ncbi:MAG TPA: S8 family serine peptidase [Chthoniobacterales bacterium]
MNIFRRSLAKTSRSVAPAFLSAAIALTIFLTPPKLSAQVDVPANIDSGLHRLITTAKQTKSVAGTGQRGARPSRFENSVIRDADQRVQVEIHLNGKEPIAAVRNQLTNLGANVIAESSSYRDGALSAFVPADRIADVARIPGVLSMSLSHRPRKNVGATTSGGVFQQGTDTLNAQGLDGTGQTIGVISDSYDTATKDLFGDPLTIHAAQDIASGDLPGLGNAANPNPVVVVEDFSDPDSVDEGRAMLQIALDVAPKAKLAFATGFVSKIDFADNIRKLRTDANCSVIVDDITYTEEPMFSDGIIAQAVDDVVNSSVLAGSKCAYFSSASNYQGGGYLSDFNPIPDATARAGLPNQNLKLDQVPVALTTGGFHNFNTDPAGPVDISQTFLFAAGSTVEFSFQWNDPFDQTPAPPDRPGVTTDYNILIFDADGNYLPAMSGTADNFSTQEAIEDIMVENAGAADVKYQIAITRAGTLPIVPVATKIRWLALDDSGDGAGGEEYYQPLAPSTHGHNCANGAISVAAYAYDDDPTNPVAPPFTPFIEDFSSPGPAVIYFDATGKRLTVPDQRMKPEIAAPDGVNTTFFGDDYEGDGFPNFFGTSAAAPHAAAIGALLLQKAGGPASLSVAQLRDVLEQSVTMEHDLDPFVSETTLMPLGRKHAKKKFTGATITLTGTGNSSNASSHDANFFTLTFHSTKKKESLLAISVDLTNAGLNFDTTTISTGFPLTLGRMTGITPSDITIGAPVDVASVSTIVLAFRPGSFKNGTSLSFGIDRDFIGDAGGNTGDYMEGGEVDAFTTISVLKGTFQNTYGFGFTIADGFGLIDAVQAAQMVHASPAR